MHLWSLYLLVQPSLFSHCEPLLPILLLHFKLTFTTCLRSLTHGALSTNKQRFYCCYHPVLLIEQATNTSVHLFFSRHLQSRNKRKLDLFLNFFMFHISLLKPASFPYGVQDGLRVWFKLGLELELRRVIH